MVQGSPGYCNGLAQASSDQHDLGNIQVIAGSSEKPFIDEEMDPEAQGEAMWRSGSWAEAGATTNVISVFPLEVPYQERVDLPRSPLERVPPHFLSAFQPHPAISSAFLKLVPPCRKHFHLWTSRPRSKCLLSPGSPPDPSQRDFFLTFESPQICWWESGCSALP